ncbi:PREDICTED: F-box protein At5g25290-like [Camelina sativa]|uniref:F-box protein At5g25290-like n=1 Tax=Camelina sativa TaxID=90675 RepID=A0ABM1REJ8_CAMSA|nr:PREDICTED: F-box protein At5g25290-like [Camelina sativa]
MKTPNFAFRSDLPMDILTSVFKRLSFVDLHRAKIVCLNWYSCSKQTLLCKKRHPWLILFPENDVCSLYNPDEGRVYKTKRDFSGIRFLENSGNWFLVLDSKSKLYIINLFSEKHIDLPPLESMKRDHYSLERVGDNEFKENDDTLMPFRPRDYVYETISYNIAVTTSGEVLLVEIYFYKTTMQRRFSLFKKDPNPDPDAILNNPNPLVEVYSLGDEALLLDLGITVPADHTLGIEPNSIYFTRHDRACKRGLEPSCLDICVFNLATKNLKRFPGLSNLWLTDARWFLPS